uniref:Secreted protein n=1 Tax=Syphacia muris TaxID=451379 RepID=A0A0N5ARE8_9BILA
MSLNTIVVAIVEVAVELILIDTMICAQREYSEKKPHLECYDAGRNYSLNSPIDYLLQLIPFSGTCSGTLTEH